MIDIQWFKRENPMNFTREDSQSENSWYACIYIPDETRLEKNMKPGMWTAIVNGKIFINLENRQAAVEQCEKVILEK